MSNSSLVTYVKLSPHCNKPRNHKIDTITIHHMAGTGSIESCGAIFANPNRNGSSNYGIGSDGRIGMYVEEANRAWTSHSGANDHRAITIEVANSSLQPPYPVSDAALSALIKLCADICKRNGIPKLLWKNDKKLIGQVDKQNMTIHKWFAATACPGDYLHGKMGYITDEVNKILGGVTVQAVDRYTSNGLTFIKAKNFKVVYYDGAKNNYNAQNYINAGFFGVFDNGITLPAGNVCVDINLSGLADIAQHYLKKYVNNGKLRFNCGNNFSNQFKTKKVSTLIVNNSGKVHIGEYNSLPTDCKYAISGVPVIRDGVDVSYNNFVKPQGWDNSCMYATYRHFLGIKDSEIWIITGSTSTNNYVSTSEIYNKLKGEGITDVICLDGGGSYVIAESGKNKIATSGNRRINTVVEF